MTFLHGDLIELDDLTRCEIMKAKACFVFSDPLVDDFHKEDKLNFLRCLIISVSKYLRDSSCENDTKETSIINDSR